MEYERTGKGHASTYGTVICDRSQNEKFPLGLDLRTNHMKGVQVMATISL